MRQQMRQSQAQSRTALQEARSQAAALQRQLDEERCGNLAKLTTSELMRTVRAAADTLLSSVCSCSRGVICAGAMCCNRALRMPTDARAWFMRAGRRCRTT